MATGLSTIYLYHYNNYYNRIQKRFATIAEYSSYQLSTNGTDSPSPITGVSFNSGNMVDTNQVVNRISFELSGAPDYAIVMSEDDNTKWSRWFVIACTRLRAGQYNLTMRRDLISDYYDDIIESDCFIEKGACKSNDHAIFNKDITTSNLIKTYEDYLCDSTHIPWIVGYIPRDSFTISDSYNAVINYDGTDDKTVLGSIGQKITIKHANLTKYNGGTSSTTGWKLAPGDYEISFEDKTNDGSHITFVYDPSYTNTTINTNTTTKITLNLPDGYGGTNTYYMDMPDPAHRVHTKGLPYDIFIAPADVAYVLNSFDSDKPMYCDPNIEIAMAINIPVGFDNTSPSEGGVGTVYDTQIVPYIPDSNVFRNSYGDSFTSITGLKAPNLRLEAQGFTPVKITDVNGNFKGIIYFISSDTNTEIIETTKTSNTASEAAYIKTGEYNAKKVKEMTNLTEFRLVSPDYTSMYSINPAAVSVNGLHEFIVRQTLKPYSPTITVTPSYTSTTDTNYSGGLYGGLRNDEKCLICTGSSYSIPQITSAWAQYQLSNSNYQSAFNRQIDDMEVNKSVEQTNDIMSTIASTASGAGTAALSGAMVGGGPVGAAVGAVVGGGASLTAGITQTVLNQQMAQREIDSAKIQFNYSIQNIKAQPYTLTNTGNNSPLNNHIPRLEYYTASSTDYANYDKTIALNGMTLNRPGKIAESIEAKNPFDTTKTYVLGNLINLNTDTSHSLSFEQVEAIAHEIARGQYYE
jgi:hypothetical protein